MKKNLDYKILLLGGEKVSILQSYTHTYVVQFESGREQEVKKCYVKSYYPNRVKSPRKKKKNKTSLSKSKPKPITKIINTQTELKFN